MMEKQLPVFGAAFLVYTRMVHNYDFFELATQRQSDRSYTDKPIEPEKLERILECARLAPLAFDYG